MGRRRWREEKQEEEREEREMEGSRNNGHRGEGVLKGEQVRKKVEYIIASSIITSANNN